MNRDVIECTMVGGEGGGNDRLCSSVQNETVCDVIQKKGMWMSVTIYYISMVVFNIKKKCNNNLY